MQLLFMFGCIPDVWEFFCKHWYIIFTIFWSHLLKSNKSSAKHKWVKWSWLHLGWYWKCCNPLIFCKILDKYSMQMTNNRGDIGSPCLKPPFDLKNPCIESFIINENIGEVTHSMTSLINCSGKSKHTSISLRNSQSTVS